MANEKFDHAFGMSFEESVSNVTATNSVELGTRVFHKGSEYVYVYNAETNGEIPPKEGVALITGATGYSVTGDGVTNIVNNFVGVVVHNTLTTGTYGWVLNRGIATILMSTTTSCTNAGALLACADAGKFEVVTFNTLAAAGRGLSVVHAQAMETIASGDSGLAFVRGI